MKTASVAEISANFADYLKASEKGPVVVTKQGKPVAVLLASSDSEELERLVMAHSPKLNAMLDAARRRFRAGQGIPHDVFWERVAKKVTQRAKTRRTTARRTA